MKFVRFCTTLGIALLCLASHSQAANLISFTQSLSAQQLDPALPNQPLEKWLTTHLPINYSINWRKQVSDCGDSKNQDGPQCVEILIKKGDKTVGNLALLVATEKHGILKEGMGLYQGQIEYLNTTHRFRQLSDILQLNVTRPEK